MRYFVVIGLLLLQAILCSANDICTQKSGVEPVECPQGVGGGTPGSGGSGPGSGGQGGKNVVPIETCKEYDYAGPKSVTYEILGLQPSQVYQVRVNGLFDEIIVRSFECRRTPTDPKKCHLYRLGGNASPPFLLTEGVHKRFCVNGGKDSTLKFKIVTEDCLSVPAGYIKMAQLPGYLKPVATPKTYDAARADCLNDDPLGRSDLVVIKSDVKNQEVWDLQDSAGIAGVRIGLKQKSGERWKYEWVDGTEVTVVDGRLTNDGQDGTGYQYWMSLTMIDSDVHDGKDCVQQSYDPPVRAWWDRSCSDPTQYVCEFKP